MPLIAIAYDYDALLRFIAESNKIEGILRNPTLKEIEAHAKFIQLPSVAIADLEAFVAVCAPGHRLRNAVGMDVSVGNYVPPAGGDRIPLVLENILSAADFSSATPYWTHRDYESLHPFTDGNGRSGRALWLWMHIKRGRDYLALHRGFLHTWYYESLAEAHLKPMRDA